MQNHRLLVSIVIIMGVLVLVGATTLTIFAFKKMKSTPVMHNTSLSLGNVTVEGISASNPNLYLLLKDKVSHNYKVCILDETTGSQKGEIVLNTN